MDDPERLRKFFRAKGHKQLVFRVADVLDMRADDQSLLIDTMARLGWATMPDEVPLRSKLQAAGVRGYICLSIEMACQALSLEELQALQALIYSYKETRSTKWFPSVEKPCDCTDNGTKIARVGCTHCSGRGMVNILVELSDEEQLLAEGKTWEEIDHAGK
jgi:hypothetical protein